ncbi:receptor-like protein 7 [Senna tora]|uniref:Receptor-like protein 7 n=1 Tax=Senna tora TaxID=362788 RepID=A0A834XK85_9FABA|nr:receptor-like protein 7 [Senna tora]
MTTILNFCLFLIPLCFLNLSTNIFVVSSGYCPTHQESSLLHLKNSLLFNPTKSKKLVHWNQSYDYCRWNGIKCSEGRVIALDLSGESISGRIDASSSLFDLQSVQNLNLAYNDLKGQIPESFVSLTNLTTLQLSNCNLSGVFPTKIFQIPNLQVLDISDNQDLHGSLPNFPHHGSLQILNISHTSFSGELPYSIHNLRKLSTLDLSNCRFNGTIPSSISELTHLVHLDLSDNYFTGLLPSFNKSMSLSYLSLFQNDLRGEITSHFEGLENVTTIDLASNSLNGTIPLSLFTIPSLQKLMLSSNRFEGLLDEFPNASSSTLEMLDVSGNNLQGPIPVSIFHLRRLRFLQLAFNKFNGTIHLDLVGRMENLAVLDLSHNNLLVDANLRENHELSFFPKLSILRLVSCKLREFPSFLRNRSALRELDLSDNHIHGAIPSWIWSFNGTIPKCLITRMSSTLRALNLGGNNFRGQISDTFSTSCALRILDLNENFLGGTIPESLANCQKLQVLNLGNNQLFDRL